MATKRRRSRVEGDGESGGGLNPSTVPSSDDGVVGTEELIKLDPSKVHVVEGRNRRFDPGNLEELAASIKVNGVEKPVTVQFRDGRYQLVDGHRRLEACLMLLQQEPEVTLELPAICVPDSDDEADILIHMLIANDGLPFKPLEEAMMLQALRDGGLSNEEVARRIGKSLSHVSDRLSLLRADESVQEAVQNGELTASDAVTVIRKSRGDKDKQREVVERVKEEGSNKVIQQELKKGRLQKHQWDTVEALYDEAWAALTAAAGIKEAGAMMKKENPLEEYLQDPQLEAAFRLGQLDGAARLASLSLKELWERIGERVTGKSTKEEDGKTPSK